MGDLNENREQGGHVRPHPEEQPKRRVSERPPPEDEKGLPLGNGATGEPPVFPPHN